MDYKITPIQTADNTADGVYKNEYGAWLGIVDWQATEEGDDKQVVLPLLDDDLNYIEAPDNWRELIIEAL